MSKHLPVFYNTPGQPGPILDPVQVFDRGPIDRKGPPEDPEGYG